MRVSVEVSLVAAYWSSYVLIGGMLLAYVRRFKSLRGFTNLVQMMPLPAQIFVSFGLGFAAMAPWIIIGFVLHAPTKLLVIIYALYALASLMAAVRYRGYIWARVRGIRPTKSWLSAAMLLLAFVLAADYIWSLYIGAFIANGNDAYVHMAKIQQLAHGNLTLADPYFSGVIESRYHLNFIHVLNAVGVRGLHMQTIDVWNYGYPFFRLMCWLAIFTFAWYFSPIRNRRLFAAVATLVAMVSLVGFFAAANYPNVMVLSWVGLAIIGLSRFVRGEDNWLLPCSALLIGMTHPAYGVGVAGFMALVSAYLAVFERSWLTRTRLWTLAATFSLLLWPALLAAAFPNRISDQIFSFGVPIAHITNHIVVLRPQLPGLFSWAMVTLFLSLLGYVALIKSRQNRREKVVLGILVGYFVIVAYNPIVSAVAGKQLPPWLIARFQYIDRLSVIAAVAGILYAAMIISRRVPKPYRLRSRALIAVVLLVPIVAASTLGFRTYRVSRTENRHEFIYMQSMQQLAPLIHNQRVFALAGDSFILPAVTTMSVITMPVGNASPVANMSLRASCADYLTQTLDSNGLATAGVTRVMVGAWEPDLMSLAKQKPYLHVVGGNSNFIIFGFSAPHNHKTVEICNIPHGQ